MTTNRYTLRLEWDYWVIYDHLVQTTVREVRFDIMIPPEDLRRECERLNAEWQKEIAGL